MAALDSVEMTSDPEDQLDDDFVIKVESLLSCVLGTGLETVRFQVPIHKLNWIGDREVPGSNPQVELDWRPRGSRFQSTS